MAGTVAIITANSTVPSAPQQIYLPDTSVAWAGVGLLVTFSSGASATASVEVSGDGVNFWNPHDTLVGITASANGNLAYPVLYVRLHLTAYASGTVTLQVIQARYN
jgi:hypothetical protein